VLRSRLKSTKRNAFEIYVTINKYYEENDIVYENACYILLSNSLTFLEIVTKNAISRSPDS